VCHTATLKISKPVYRWFVANTLLETTPFNILRALFEAAEILNFSTRPWKLSLFLSNFPHQPFVAAYIYYHKVSIPVNKIYTVFSTFLTHFFATQNIVFFSFQNHKTCFFDTKKLLTSLFCPVSFFIFFKFHSWFDKNAKTSLIISI